MSRVAIALLALFAALPAARAQSYGPYPQESYFTCAPSAFERAAIIVHGGAWVRGDADWYKVTDLCEALKDAGILGVAIDYRLAGTMPWPAQLLDLQTAIRYVRKRWQPLALCVIGESAGGQMVLMAGAAGHTTWSDYADPLAEAGLYPGIASAPDCIVDISGPTDLPLLYQSNPALDWVIDEFIAKMNFAPATAMALASPARQALGAMPPTLILQGADDSEMPAAQPAALTAVASFVDWVYRIYPGGHVFDGMSLVARTPWYQLIGAFIGAFR